MYTEIEGEWDEVMSLVKACVKLLADKGYRTSVNLKADIRPGYTDTMQSKVAKLDSILGGKRG
jgi:uncharacterized protein YqgV (UPF0045/DUF77 family)